LHQYAKKPYLLIIKALHDGDLLTPFEPVLTIEGPYEYFGFLEGIIDGILARRSSVASNSHALINLLAQHKSNAEIIFMGDRDDDYHNQMGDGYASKIGGIHKHATDAMGLWFGGKGMGTMPHALIQGFSGNLVDASKAYLKCFSDPLIALVDYNNDVIGDALTLANALGNQLYGVRVDTSPMMVDQYFMRHPEVLGQFDPRGINPQLICILRKALDDAHFKHVKIIASGGFNITKLQHFLEMKAPVDVYGVGASLLKVSIGFTGDCVRLNQKPCAKAGRSFQENTRLEDVIYPSFTQNP
jgi:nicotinate phosphoribosyltransferase